MSKLNEGIQKLKDITIRDMNIINWKETDEYMVRIYNYMTSPYCQIFELVSPIIGNGQKIPEHIHENSKETFYVVKGTITFNNGDVVKETEVYAVPPQTPHGGILSPGGHAILILQPKEEQYNTEFDNERRNKRFE